MKVVSLRWARYRIPFAGDFTTAHGRAPVREGLIVWLATDDGDTGLGEAAPLPGFGGGSAEDAERLLARLGRAVAGLDVADLPARVTALLDGQPGAAAVRCALDVASLDALGRATEEPVARLLADQAWPAVPVNATVGESSAEAAAAAARRAVEAGFGTVKLKVGVAPSPDVEEERVAAVRAAIGPRARLRLDANGAWSPDDAIALIRRLAVHDLELVEQPVPAPDLDGLARVRRAVDVPLAADEAVTGPGSMRRIIDAEAADVVVVKPMAVGGLRPGREIVEMAADAGMRAIVTTTIDAGVAVAAALHLAATLPPPVLACGLATAALLETDLLVRPLPVEAGAMRLPAGPGLGVAVDEGKLTPAAGG